MFDGGKPGAAGADDCNAHFVLDTGVSVISDELFYPTKAANQLATTQFRFLLIK